MFERGISSKDILPILMDGEIIEDYKDDIPCPTLLMLGFLHNYAIHVVVACCKDHIKIVTVYLPDERGIDDRFRSEKK